MMSLRRGGAVQRGTRLPSPRNGTHPLPEGEGDRDM